MDLEMIKARFDELDEQRREFYVRMSDENRRLATFEHAFAGWDASYDASYDASWDALEQELDGMQAEVDATRTDMAELSGRIRAAADELADVDEQASLLRVPAFKKRRMD